MIDIPTVSVENFNELVLEAKNPVIIIYWRENCRHCKMYEEVVEEIKNKYSESAKIYRFKIVDEESRVHAMKAGVSAVPTIQVSYKGYKVGELTGYPGKKQVLEAVDRFMENMDNCILKSSSIRNNKPYKG